MAGLRLFRAAAHRAMPWRNGGGVTHEIARCPESGEAFAWRISLATIARSGPFSSFAGCDRTLVLLDGGTLTLEIDGVSHDVRPLMPLAFSGDAACEATLAGPPARVLNVISTRGRAAHAIEIHALSSPLEIEPGFVVVLDGTIGIDGVQLDRYDAAQLEECAMTAGSGVVATIAVTASSRHARP